MRVVYRAENIVDAHLVKDALEQAGMPAFINGESLIGGVGQLPARDFLTVGVPDVCVDAAAPVVRAIEAMLRAPLDEDAAAAASRPEDAAAPPWRLRPAPV
jgi:hypothetical protein